MSKAFAWQYGKDLSEILGIKNLQDVTIHFPMEGQVTAEVRFILDHRQAHDVIDMCRSRGQMSPGEIKTALRRFLPTVQGTNG